MTDWFSLLGLPDRLQLTEAEIKEKYLPLAARYHPDAAGGNDESFRALQQAYKGLLDPAGRVRHLLELKFPGEKPAAGAVPLTGLFMQVGPVLQQAKMVGERWERATSTLSRTLASLEVAEALRKIKAVREAADQMGESLEARLGELDGRWPAVEAAELFRWASEWTFLAKWRTELSEWEFRLANAGPIPKVGQT